MALGGYWLPCGTMLLNQGEPHFSLTCLIPLHLSCHLGNKEWSWMTVGSARTAPPERPALCWQGVWSVCSVSATPSVACGSRVCMVSRTQDKGCLVGVAGSMLSRTPH